MKCPVPALSSACDPAQRHPAAFLKRCRSRFSDRSQQAVSSVSKVRPPRWLQVAVTACVVPLTLTVAPASAAERIYVSYGLIERSISIGSIEAYAREGKIADDLLAYTKYTTPEQLEQLQPLLLTRADVSPIAVSQFLYTEQGETVLKLLGEVIQTEARLSGFYPLRSALILAASDPDGLTPLNVLKKFPVYGIRVDVERTLQIVQQLERLINQTNGAIATIERQSAIEAAAEPYQNFGQLPDPRQPGEYTWQQETILLKDPTRRRSFDTDLYLPLTRTGNPLPNPAPLIVISHGLGSDRTTYAYLAEHLASYGFAVALPEHPGSNSDQLQALIQGRANEVAEATEFIDRPLDIKFLLNDLERRSQYNPRFRGRIDLQRVGVVGQSFGAYTALALAGAEINLPQLSNDCVPLGETFNLSLLLQCRALSLPQPTADLRDSRVKAVIAVNLIGSSILGETSISKINLPVMIVTGNADTIAPSLPEQIRPFTWLTSPNKYLLLIRGSTHFSTLGEPKDPSTVVKLPAEILGPDRGLARRYLNAMSVAFLQTYVANKPAYRVYLGSAYVRNISQEVLPLRLLQSLTPSQLAQSLNDPKPPASANQPDLNVSPAPSDTLGQQGSHRTTVQHTQL